MLPGARRILVLAALFALAAAVVTVPSAAAATTGPLVVTIAGTIGGTGDAGPGSSMPFSGSARFAGLIEETIEGDGVVIAFEPGDVREPIVVGSLWSSRESPPETIACAGRVCVLRGAVAGVGNLANAEVDPRPGGRVLLGIVVRRATCEPC